MADTTSYLVISAIPKAGTSRIGKISLFAGYGVLGRGIKAMARENMPVFIWVNFFATWPVGGTLMLYLGATTGSRA